MGLSPELDRAGDPKSIQNSRVGWPLSWLGPPRAPLGPSGFAFSFFDEIRKSPHPKPSPSCEKGRGGKGEGIYRFHTPIDSSCWSFGILGCPVGIVLGFVSRSSGAGDSGDIIL